ncbi:NADP-dependent phosphogluconate dehydrogenase [Micrococcoides hystricis]|uniref:6-phosphogluconate dehydrogenase, decarboxylating n=1 Tax=Micrococcoides hystricis TaxID=1572761 RepID=A0ABV6PC97_9MICC
MGANLARNFARHGYTVAVHNRSIGRTENLLAEHGDEGNFIKTESLSELVEALERPRRVLLMIQAGSAVDAVIEDLLPLLDEDDIIIDAGNSHFADTRRREEYVASKGFHFVGIGVSGGEEGALNGPSIMPGGSEKSYESLGPLLESIAADYNGEPCCSWIGTDGAGHFVKMVHNGIEYADMQVIGETYDVLRTAAGKEPAEQAQIFRDWNDTELSSYLIEITAEVLGHQDAKTGKPLVDVIVDAAGQKGTGRWTGISGLELGSAISAIAESVFARSLSSLGDIRTEAQQKLAPALGEVPSVGEDFVEDVRLALYASKLVSYAQGLDMLQMADSEYGWELKLDEIAALWRAGCIIRAELLDTIMKEYAGANPPANLLFAPRFTEAMATAVPALRKVVGVAAAHGIPTPVFSAALAYYDGLRRDRLPAALIQGQRDFFGAHTYKRVDEPGAFHTDWSGDRREEKMD